MHTVFYLQLYESAEFSFSRPTSPSSLTASFHSDVQYVQLGRGNMSSTFGSLKFLAHSSSFWFSRFFGRFSFPIFLFVLIDFQVHFLFDFSCFIFSLKYRIPFTECISKLPHQV